jgi:hypothetical protein
MPDKENPPNELPAPHPFWERLRNEISKLTAEIEKTTFHWQLEQASKTPHRMSTVNGVIVPDPTLATGATARQLAPRRTDRETVILSNTGSYALLIGNSPSNAMNNGFTIAAGGSVSIDVKDAVFGWCVGGNTTTVDVLETLYFNPVRTNDPPKEDTSD